MPASLWFHPACPWVIDNSLSTHKGSQHLDSPIMVPTLVGVSSGNERKASSLSLLLTWTRSPIVGDLPVHIEEQFMALVVVFSYEKAMASTGLVRIGAPVSS